MDGRIDGGMDGRWTVEKRMVTEDGRYGNGSWTGW